MFLQESLLKHPWVDSTLEHTSLNVPAFHHVPGADVPHLRISPAGRFRRHFDHGQCPLQLLAIGDRIVAGNRALSTAVRPPSSAQANEWELEATAPELKPASDNASGLPPAGLMTAQALTGSTVTPGSITFGEFTDPRRV